MLPTEAINRIQVLSERGMGSKAIAKSTGISRNTVRKYLSHFQTLTPISSEVQRPSRLDVELGRGRGISNLDKKARITRPAPLI